MKETDLYPPVKSYLEALGYEVKAEVASADLVAMRPGEDPVIVELKTGFSLALFHQAIARQRITDCVYVAVPRGKGQRYWQSLKANISLARRLGVGVMTVRLEDGFVELRAEPGPYRPRMSKQKQTRLLREFDRRDGDPNVGGQVKQTIVTAYRQDAMECAGFIAFAGASRGAEVAKATGVRTATRIMADNHYGWFERVARGIYDLSESGKAAAGKK